MTTTLQRFPMLCLQLIASGYSPEEVAERLDTDTAAVRSALGEAQEHLKTSNDVHSVAVALSRGLIR